MRYLKTFIEYGVYPLTAWISLIGTGLFFYGVYLAATDSTNADLLTVGGGMMVGGVLTCLLLAKLFKDSKVSLAEYTFNALFWAIL